MSESEPIPSGAERLELVVTAVLAEASLMALDKIEAQGGSLEPLTFEMLEGVADKLRAHMGPEIRRVMFSLADRVGMALIAERMKLIASSN